MPTAAISAGPPRPGLHHLAQHRHLGVEDVPGVVLNPAGLGENAEDTLVDLADRLTLVVEQDRAGAGGSLIQRKRI